MTYPYVDSKFHYGTRKVTRGLLFHMAEGGHTTHFLSKAGGVKTGVSVHFVIEYSGRIVQMLKLSEVSGGINPRLVRRDDDPPFVLATGAIHTSITYGITAASMVLGGWVTNPNNALVQVEVEGFARTGPNLSQKVAIKNLAADMLGTFPTIRGILGHRDLQRYKACPGKLFPLVAIGGHGRIR